MALRDLGSSVGPKGVGLVISSVNKRSQGLGKRNCGMGQVCPLCASGRAQVRGVRAHRPPRLFRGKTGVIGVTRITATFIAPAKGVSSMFIRVAIETRSLRVIIKG